MMGAVHAGIGAALGSLCKTRTGAFVAGIASHVIADILPHTDYPPKVEAPLVAASLAGIAAWRGVDSPEFWGAIGAVAPDVEHGLKHIGLITEEQEIFPTHGPDPCPHGGETGEHWSQALITIAAVVLIGMKSRIED